VQIRKYANMQMRPSNIGGLLFLGAVSILPLIIICSRYALLPCLPVGKSATKPTHKGFSGVAASTCLPAGTVGANFEHLFFSQQLFARIFIT
jgi:hypothetical protein